MNQFDRQPGAIDDPGMKGGIEPDQDPLPPGDHAGSTGDEGEPHASELDLPGPDDPVAWSYIEPDTLVVGRDGKELGRVVAMLGTEDEGIFHGVAIDPSGLFNETRIVPADAVTRLTPARVEVTYDRAQLERAEEYHEREPR